MKCQAEVERIIRDPRNAGHGFMGSRQLHDREIGRCSRNALYERPLYPAIGEEKGFSFVDAKVCAQHFRGSRPRKAAGV